MPKFFVWNVGAWCRSFMPHTKPTKNWSKCKKIEEQTWSEAWWSPAATRRFWFGLLLLCLGQAAKPIKIWSPAAAGWKLILGQPLPRTQINDQRAAAIRGCAVFSYTMPGVDISGHGHMARVGEEMYLDCRKNQRLVRVGWHWGPAAVAKCLNSLKFAELLRVNIAQTCLKGHTVALPRWFCINALTSFVASFPPKNKPRSQRKRKSYCFLFAFLTSTPNCDDYCVLCPGSVCSGVLVFFISLTDIFHTMAWHCVDFPWLLNWWIAVRLLTPHTIAIPPAVAPSERKLLKDLRGKSYKHNVGDNCRFLDPSFISKCEELTFTTFLVDTFMKI